MEVTSIFKAFLDDLKLKFPESVTASEFNSEDLIAHLEANFYPSVIKIIQRDATFFDEPRMMFGVDISELWNDSDDEDREVLWKHVFMSIVATFLSGDIRDKLSTIISSVKTFWNASGKENDEVSRILNDEHAEDRIKEILDYVSETRIAKIFLDVVEKIDVSDLGIDFEHPEQIIDLIKNPEHPTIKKIISKIQNIIQEKVKTGQITQQIMISEIEGIKAKVQSMFGNIFNDMLGGRRAEVPAGVLMGNSPEARRQRMIARLQKKQRDKNSS
jgi:hypothetical protein